MRYVGPTAGGGMLVRKHSAGATICQAAAAFKVAGDSKEM